MSTMSMRTSLASLGLARLVRWGAIALLLLAPLVAMQFTREVAWTASDFAVAAALLIGGETSYELAAAKVRGRGGRLAIAALVIGVVGLIWAQGAVGIF